MKTIEQLEQVINSIQRFQNEQRKLQDVIDVLAGSSTAVNEFGNEFIDAYIDLADSCFGGDGWIEWYVYENNFGRKKLKAGYHNDVNEVSNINDLWKLIKVSNKEIK